MLIITNDVVTTEDAKHVQRTLKGILLEAVLGVRDRRLPHRGAQGTSMNLAAVEDMGRASPTATWC